MDLSSWVCKSGRLGLGLLQLGLEIRLLGLVRAHLRLRLRGFSLGLGQLLLGVGELGAQVVDLDGMDDEEDREGEAGREQPEE